MRRTLILITVFFLALIPSQYTQASVELIFFSAFFDPAGIRVEWKTASETDNSGFYILRSTSVNGVYDRVIFVLSESIHGEGIHYIFLDDTIERGQVYYYKLEIVDLSMNSEFVGPISAAYGVATWTPTPSLTQTPGGVSQATRTPTATIKTNLTPTTSATLQATLNPYLIGTPTTLPLSTLTATPPSTLQLSPTVSTGTVATLSLSATITTTIETVPTSEILFPGPLEIGTPTPTKTVLATETSLPLTPGDTQAEKLSGKSFVLLSIPVTLWIALAAFLIIFVKKIFAGT